MLAGKIEIECNLIPKMDFGTSTWEWRGCGGKFIKSLVHFSLFLVMRKVTKPPQLPLLPLSCKIPL